MKKIIEIKKDEYWYGGAVNDGFRFPLTSDSQYFIDMTYNDTYNQLNPLFVSSKGRYIWLEQAGKVRFDNGKIHIEGEEIELDEASNTLKEAYLRACHRHFAPTGKEMPLKVFNPQCCSWIELFYEQNQESLLEYAKGFVKSSEERGIFIVDEGWQMDYGMWEFDLRKFPEPKKFVDELHEMGFLVMPWICPYISPDSKAFRELEGKNLFLCDEKGEPLLVHWWNGYSVQLDFSKKEAREWFNHQLKYLREEYGIDGFKMDGGDAVYLPKSCKDGNLHNYYWSKGVDCEIKELRACYKLAGEPIIQRLSDKAHRWDVLKIGTGFPPDGCYRYGLSTVLPNMLTAGITGYAYTCPDMVGGGLWSDFWDKTKLDNELIIRSLQCSILMPLVQFSLAIWKIEKDNLKAITEDTLVLRRSFLPYIQELVKQSAKTGEPIVRYMEYEFPGQGLEEASEQFMLGDKYLVAPILEKGATVKKISLPKGVWKDYYTNKKYNGEQEIALPINLTSLPIFERL